MHWSLSATACFQRDEGQILLSGNMGQVERLNMVEEEKLLTLTFSNSLNYRTSSFCPEFPRFLASGNNLTK